MRTDFRLSFVSEKELGKNRDFLSLLNKMIFIFTDKWRYICFSATKRDNCIYHVKIVISNNKCFYHFSFKLFLTLVFNLTFVLRKIQIICISLSSRLSTIRKSPIFYICPFYKLLTKPRFTQNTFAIYIAKAKTPILSTTKTQTQTKTKPKTSAKV